MGERSQRPAFVLTRCFLKLPGGALPIGPCGLLAQAGPIRTRTAPLCPVLQRPQSLIGPSPPAPEGLQRSAMQPWVTTSTSSNNKHIPGSNVNAQLHAPRWRLPEATARTGAIAVAVASAKPTLRATIRYLHQRSMLQAIYGIPNVVRLTSRVLQMPGALETPKLRSHRLSIP